MPDREYIIGGLESFLCNVKAKKSCEINGIMLSADDVESIVAMLKAQEPRLITEADFENADEYGFIPVWCEETNKNCYWNCIPRSALETAKEDRCRYWTAKPSLKQMEETPWE